MNILKEYKMYIVTLMVNLMFTFRIMAQSYLMTDFNFIPLLIIFSISVIAYFILDFIFKKPVHKILFMLIIGIIALSYIFYYRLEYNLFMPFYNSVNSINEAVKNTSVTYYGQYKIFFICFIPILVFIFLTFANMGLLDLVLIYSTGIMILFWYIGFPKIVKENLFLFIFIGLMSFGVNNCMKGLRKLKKSNPNMKINSVLVSLFLVIPVLAISYITTKLPQEYQGNYKGIIGGKLINSFAPSMKTPVKATYDLTDSGYSNNLKKLGGPINVNDESVFSVKGDKSEYLRGSIKDKYNGSTWSKSNEDYSLKVKEGYSVFATNTSLSKFLYNEKKLIIYPEQNKNSSIFAPIYAYNVQLDKGTVYYDNIPSFIADLSKVKSYSVNYYDTQESQAFENCSSLDWLNSKVGRGYSAEFRKKYENYLQVPSTVTQRTRDLLFSIAPYGQSRFYAISKIKKYLDETYPYTTYVSQVPENQDFIDNFLFTEKQGYCVYFATAATIFCRMQGIPARYVEGFKMPASKASDGLYKVTNKEAHAWCEILVDPEKDLWTTLEVTPSAVSAISTTQTSEEIVPDSAASVASDSEVEKQPEVIDATSNNIAIGSYKFSKVNIAVGIFLAIVIIVLTKILAVLAGIKKVLEGRSVIPYYRYCTKRLKRIGIVKPDNLADLEHIETLEDKKLESVLKEVALSAYDEFYGKKFQDNINRVNSYKELEGYIKGKQSRVIYLLKKYLFL